MKNTTRDLAKQNHDGIIAVLIKPLVYFANLGKVNLLLSLIFTIILGCSPMPAKTGTTLEHIKTELKQASLANHNLKLTKLPTAIENTLKPQLIIAPELSHNFTNLEHKFNISADNVPATAFFLSLVEGTDFNLTIHPRVAGTIAVKLKAVTVLEALEIVQQIYGYGIELSKNNIKILPAELQTKTFKVNYLDIVRDGTSETKINSSGLSSAADSTSQTDNSSSSSDSSSTAATAAVNSKINTSSKVHFWGKLETTLKTIIGSEEGRKVAVLPITGMIVIQAMPDELTRVEKFLKQAELFLNRQVILETKILEVELNDAYKAGINWATLGKNLNASQLAGSIHNNADIDTSLPISANTISTSTNSTGNAAIIPLGTTPMQIASNASPFGGIFTLGFNYHNLAAFVELLGSQGNVQVLSSPRISTTNNQKALIKVGSDAFYVTDVTSSTATTASGSIIAPTVKFDAFFSGIALDVTPQIEEDGHVTLHIHPTISVVTEQTKNLTISNSPNQYPLATSTIRESDSIIRAKNGQFVVIGGLMQDKMGEIVTGVPGLKDIPFLGSIFRQTRQQAKKTELVILLRPLIMNDQAWNNALTASYDAFNNLEQGFHFGGNPQLYGTMAEKLRK